MRVLLCPLSNPGYLYSTLAIGRELRARGHLVAVLCSPGAVATVTLAGLLALNVEEYGPPLVLSVGSWHWVAEGPAQYTAVMDAARDLGADVLLTSILCHGALLAAERLDIPAVVLGLSAWLWPYRGGGPGEGDTAERDWRIREVRALYDEIRSRTGLAPRRDRHPEQPLLGSAFLLRGHPALEPPGAELPKEAVHVGPCAWEPPPDPGSVALIEQETRRIGKPVVYVHLGRTFGGDSMWPRLNAAFTRSPFQAVVERGRSGDPDPAPAGDLLVVRKPWMDPLIALASLVLTNATSAPVLAALRHGRPLVVAPNGSEQPVLAAACRRAGVAVRFPDHPGQAVEVLSDALADPELARHARGLGSRLRALAGARAAAQIVLAQCSSPSPVPADQR
ncbi:glycosyltransferase [Nonomuraea sp. CA-141351]|uniref:glycosyltransferase n=1 Tax=Nonomuraea sp. CA-141351 TaxID=3239996 RepID=UPI003D906C76